MHKFISITAVALLAAGASTTAATDAEAHGKKRYVRTIQQQQVYRAPAYRQQVVRTYRRNNAGAALAAGVIGAAVGGLAAAAAQPSYGYAYPAYGYDHSYGYDYGYAPVTTTRVVRRTYAAPSYGYYDPYTTGSVRAVRSYDPYYGYVPATSGVSVGVSYGSPWGGYYGW